MSAPVSQPTTRQATDLSIRGPVILGLMVIVLFLGGGLTAAAWLPIDKGANLSGSIIVETKSKPVQHQRGGRVERIHVTDGAEVKAGDLLISLDTSNLDQQIAAMKTQAAATRRQLELVRGEAETMAELAARQLAQRSRVSAIERQVADVEKELAGLAARILLAEEDVSRSEIRAPVAGRVLNLAVRGPGEVIAAGATVAEIVPQDERLVVEGKLSPTLIDLVQPGQATKVWLAGVNWRDAQPLTGKVQWISADSVEDRRSGVPYFVTRIELDASKSEIAKRFPLHPGQRTEILVLTGQRTLLDHILDPVMRNINRAFRA